MQMFIITVRRENVYIFAFPDGVIDDVNYDGDIRAFLFLLNNDCCTSIDKSRKFLSDLTGGKLNISKGMISKLSREFALKTESEHRTAYAEIFAFPCHAYRLYKCKGKRKELSGICLCDTGRKSPILCT
ncbi:MAG: hypothetical protein ACLVJ3_16885 [Coprococcus phoceensis]